MYACMLSGGFLKINMDFYYYLNYVLPKSSVDYGDRDFSSVVL